MEQLKTWVVLRCRNDNLKQKKKPSQNNLGRLLFLETNKNNFKFPMTDLQLWQKPGPLEKQLNRQC